MDSLFPSEVVCATMVSDQLDDELRLWKAYFDIEHDTRFEHV